VWIIFLQFVTSNFASAYIVDEHAKMISFEIPRATIPRLSQAFSLMETNKGALGIVDYALSQSTLEQVRVVLRCCLWNCIVANGGALQNSACIVERRYTRLSLQRKVSLD